MLGAMSTAAREKTLVLMRHAKAEQVLGKPDHDRELTARGRRSLSRQEPVVVTVKRNSLTALVRPRCGLRHQGPDG